MRLVHLTGPGRIELNYMWLPTWLGINKDAKDTLEQELAPLVLGRPATEEVLDEVHSQAIEVLVARYPVQGLRDYLDGLKFIRI